MSGRELIKNEVIQNRIYTIHGVQVILDEDLALLYGVETKVLNQAVKRNSERFPKDFMFQLSKDEYELLRSQNVTLEKWEYLRSQNTIPSKQHLCGAYTKGKSIAHQVVSQIETKIVQQAVAQLVQIPWEQNITKNLPDEFRSSLPDIEEIEAELSGAEESQ